MKLRCISLWQPHASAVALGLKKIETRGRYTSKDGLIGIHAALFNSSACESVFDRLRSQNDTIRTEFNRAGLKTFSSLPFGKIIAVAELVDCVPTHYVVNGISAHEKLLGNYDHGRWAWMLKDVRRLANPISAPGRQGFFFVDVEDALLKEAA